MKMWHILVAYIIGDSATDLCCVSWFSQMYFILCYKEFEDVLCNGYAGRISAGHFQEQKEGKSVCKSGKIYTIKSVS